MSSRTSWLSYAVRTFVAIAGIRAGYLSALWLYGTSGVQRHHVETAWVWFGAVGLVSCLLAARSSFQAAPGGRVDESAGPMWMPDLLAVGASVVLAVCVYGVTLQVGLLSDDAVLLSRAAGWRIGWVGDQLFRPVPMGVWASVLSIGGGDMALHALNVLTHGVNGFLVFRIARGLDIAVGPALVAVALFVLSPLAVEPVTWISGYFDVSMTLLCAIAVLLGRRYGPHPALGSRLALAAIVLTAFLTKETAVVLPILIVVDAWSRRALRSSRTLAFDCGILLAGAAAMAAVRLMLPGGEAIRQSLSRYVLQTWLFRTFGAVANPMHIELTDTWPWISLAYTAALTVLLVLAAVNAHWLRALMRPLVGQLIWLLVSVVPLVTFLYVAPDLQGARYLYLGSVAWSILIAVLVQASYAAAPALRPAVAALVALLLLASATATFWQHRLWLEAASIRDQIGDAARGAAAESGCESLRLPSLPDHHRGVYIFRNGAEEWFQLRHQIRVNTSSAPSPCTFYWDGQSLRPTP